MSVENTGPGARELLPLFQPGRWSRIRHSNRVSHVNPWPLYGFDTVLSHTVRAESHSDVFQGTSQERQPSCYGFRHGLARFQGLVSDPPPGGRVRPKERLKARSNFAHGKFWLLRFKRCRFERAVAFRWDPNRGTPPLGGLPRFQKTTGLE